MMARIQIALDTEFYKRARTRASDMGVSFAEYIRRLVARDLDVPQQRSDPSVVFDLGRSGHSDVAQDKDDMVGDAVAAERSRKPYRTDR